MAGNTTTKKQYGSVAEMPVSKASPPRGVSAKNIGGTNMGQMRGNSQMEQFGAPMNDGINAALKGLGGTYNDIGEVSGFIVDGYLDKGGTEFGEAAKFNFMPPGMDIGNQVNAEIHEMKLYKLTAESYPGDGWMPTPRDVME